jgi:hypothetical protein
VINLPLLFVGTNSLGASGTDIPPQELVFLVYLWIGRQQLWHTTSGSWQYQRAQGSRENTRMGRKYVADLVYTALGV